jgi:ATP-dependent RNA helicase DBP3
MGKSVKKDKKEKKDKKDKKSKKEKKEKKRSAEKEAVVSTKALEKRVEAVTAAPAASSSSSSSSSAAASNVDWLAWRKENGVRLLDDNEESHDAKFAPWTTFDDFPASAIPPKLLNVACGTFAKPTPIQAQALPLLAAGRDVVGCAETGSGKTLAFGLPGLARSATQRDAATGDGRRFPCMLVLAPTRELARQSDAVLKPVAESQGYRSICVYGGVPKVDQLRALRKGVLFIIATPGRLLDLMSEGNCDLSYVSFFVLDEADRMLDMGFEREVRQIAEACGTALPASARRQTAMFSATWPMEIRKLASEFMVDPLRIIIGTDELQANGRVTQQVELFDDDRRRQGRLLRVLQSESKEQLIIVFALYKKEASRLHRLLEQNGYKVALLSGDCSQQAREHALASFRKGSLKVLVATDVAARGLDIPNVELVINYSFPLTIEDYVHRIGRTGRAGKSGRSITFFHDADKQHAAGLVHLLKETGNDVPPKLMTKYPMVTKKKEHSMYGAHYNPDVDPSAPRKKVHIKF